jgi:hypothetical protein
MNTGNLPDGLRLTEDEAYSLLGLCLTSPTGLDPTSERALRKLADFCTSRSNPKDHSIIQSDQRSTCARAR